MGMFDFLKKEELAKINKLAEENARLKSSLSALKKYETIVDAESEAKRIIDEANNRAKVIVEQAIETSDNLKAEAIGLLKTAEESTALSNIKAVDIIREAERKAEEIIREADEASKRVRELEKTVKAMKNIIDGYGNEYIMPTQSLLDDLAEEFGFTEVGVNLKDAREQTKLMIKNGMAAKCDYVEQNRRETAILFVLDAFNGKVDSILSKVKKDNYGTLEQKIKDAYQIVNHNGTAFRNAVITPPYLSARINELKWATVVQELKWKEQEEQRLIREQIRQEERARKEYEKAIRDAEKEEDVLKKLIEKAQKEVQQASDEQKAKYEAQLKEYEERLVAAEDRSQRAISMAQQTKSGNVYIISNIGSFGEDVFKIGMTRRLEPSERIRELGDASVPFEFDIHAMIYSEDAPGLEALLHRNFVSAQVNKVNPRKEFFRVPLTEIRNEIEKMGITARWTVAAEARQYKETLAIENAIKGDKNKQIEWENSQLKYSLQFKGLPGSSQSEIDSEEMNLN